jgi:hypothetical protein
MARSSTRSSRSARSTELWCTGHADSSSPSLCVGMASCATCWTRMPLPRRVQWRRGLLHCCSDSLVGISAAAGGGGAGHAGGRDGGAAPHRRGHQPQELLAGDVPRAGGARVPRPAVHHRGAPPAHACRGVCPAVRCDSRYHGAAAQCLAPCCGGDCHPRQVEANPTSSRLLCQAERHSAAIPGRQGGVTSACRLPRS